MYVVITGASRGIGLELVHSGLERGHHVLAIARKPEESTELKALEDKFQNLRALKLDILSSSADEDIKKSIMDWPCIDVFINNAGIYLENETIEDFEKSFLTNAIKPFFLSVFRLQVRWGPLRIILPEGPIVTGPLRLP